MRVQIPSGGFEEIPLEVSLLSGNLFQCLQFPHILETDSTVSVTDGFVGTVVAIGVLFPYIGLHCKTEPSFNYLGSER
jgi:hypothetical protein